jgi:hypothetical protein
MTPKSLQFQHDQGGYQIRGWGRCLSVERPSNGMPTGPPAATPASQIAPHLHSSPTSKDNSMQSSGLINAAKALSERRKRSLLNRMAYKIAASHFEAARSELQAQLDAAEMRSRDTQLLATWMDSLGGEQNS